MKKLAVLPLVLLMSGSVSWAQSPVEKGAELFNEYGCAGCHIPGQAWSAPDLVNITAYYDKERLVDFIANTSAHYDEPVVKTMAERYARYMGNQEVSREEAELIYQYLQTLQTRGK